MSEEHLKSYYEKRKKETARRRAWYQSLGPQKKEEVKARMRAYYHQNKEKINARIKKQRAARREARSGKTPVKPDTKIGVDR